jgi:hypothetical protein
MNKFGYCFNEKNMLFFSFNQRQLKMNLLERFPNQNPKLNLLERFPNQNPKLNLLERFPNQNPKLNLLERFPNQNQKEETRGLFYATLNGGNEESCPSFGLAKELKALPFVSEIRGKSKMNLLERFPNQNPKLNLLERFPNQPQKEETRGLFSWK